MFNDLRDLKYRSARHRDRPGSSGDGKNGFHGSPSSRSTGDYPDGRALGSSDSAGTSARNKNSNCPLRRSRIQFVTKSLLDRPHPGG